jgi:hypothetical protein
MIFEKVGLRYRLLLESFRKSHSTLDGLAIPGSLEASDEGEVGKVDFVEHLTQLFI